METKSVFKSKTFWFNLLTGVIAVIAIINTDFLTSLGITPDKQEVVLKVTGAVVGAINIALRFVTTTAVTAKK